MPVTKSAKKALRTATRRHEENIVQREAFKKAAKAVRKAVDTGSDTAANLFTQAQSALDRAAKNNTIHKNKASRLKSRLAKKLAGIGTAAPVVKKAAKAKTAVSKTKAAAKKKAATKK
ncbi:MAG: 30S ribosomal protein S20 [bacterium]